MTKSAMEWKTLPIDQLKPAAYNPRRKLKPGDKEYEKIKNSIQEFGYVEPIVVNYDMTVISGHQRLTVLKDLGYTEVQCVMVHIEDEHKVKALNVAFNKITGAWDEKMLADLLVDLQSVDFNVDLTGFEAPEVEQLFSKVHNKDIEEDDFDVEGELEKPTFSKPGDIWTLGRHKVLCGDSTLMESYEMLLGTTKVNMVLSDLPYFVDYHGSAGTIKNDNLPDDKAYDFCKKAMDCMHDVLADDGSIYIFHADTKGLIFRQAFHDAGFYLSGCCIWKKNALVLGRSPYQFQHEPCLFGWKKGGRHQWYADRKQTTIWEYDRPKSNKLHPTMKPVALMAYPIRNSTMTNGLVLDPFLGSGSTLIACEETERVCYGIELEPKYIDVIVKRYIEKKNGRSDDVKLLRDGKELSFSDVKVSE